MQIVYVVPYSNSDENYNRSDPYYNLVLPVLGGLPIEKVGPFSLPENPSYPHSLGPELIHLGDPYPLQGIPKYFNGDSTGKLVPSISGGTIVLLYPLGVNDWLVATRYSVCRITGGAVIWTHPVVPMGAGSDCMVCAIVSSGGDYHIVLKTKVNDTYDATARAYYHQIDITGSVSPGLYSTWPSIDLVVSEFSEFGLSGYEAVPLVFPSFDYAMVGSPSYSADGVSFLGRAVLVGPATDTAGGKEVTGYGIGETTEGPFSQFMGQFTLAVDVSGGDITNATRWNAAATYSTHDLEALASDGQTPEVSGGSAFLYFGAPPPAPAFWMHLKRATEII